MRNGGNAVPSITNAEHIGPDDTGDNIEAKRVANYRWNANTLEWERDDGSITIDTSDIEIGAVEIKNSTDDTRATVGADGLYTEVRKVTPGTSATNLGKAIDSAVGSTDTGVAFLARKDTDSSQSAVADGDYETPSLSSWRELRTRDQRAQDIDSCNATTGWSILNNDTANLGVSTNHVFGTGALTFDKVNGSANTAFAIIQKTITAINIQDKFEDGGFVALAVYLPSLTNVVGVTIRLGTSSSHYNEWEWSADDLSAGRWLALRTPTNQPSGVTGNGWGTSSITYVAVGVEFNSESNTLAGIIVDNIHFVQGRITDSTIDSTVTTNVTSPNVNLHRVGGTQTDTNTGNASAGTMRVVLASNQPTVDTVDVNKQDALPYAEILTGSATITPTAGKRIKLVKSQVLQSPANETYNVVTLNFTSLGDVVTGWAYSDSNEWIGAIDEVLNINLSNANPVSVNIRYKET